MGQLEPDTLLHPGELFAVPTPTAIPPKPVGALVLEGGAERVVFRLLVEVERLEATLNYESAAAPPLALATVEDARLSLHVHPATLRLAASLGNLRAQDGALPEARPGEPLR